MEQIKWIIELIKLNFGYTWSAHTVNIKPQLSLYSHCDYNINKFSKTEVSDEAFRSIKSLGKNHIIIGGDPYFLERGWDGNIGSNRYHKNGFWIVERDDKFYWFHEDFSMKKERSLFAKEKILEDIESFINSLKI